MPHRAIRIILSTIAIPVLAIVIYGLGLLLLNLLYATWPFLLSLLIGWYIHRGVTSEDEVTKEDVMLVLGGASTVTLGAIGNGIWISANETIVLTLNLVLKYVIHIAS